MDRLIVICEGGAHTVEYLHKNKVYPDALVLEPSKFQEMVPYLSKEDDILLIIKGLTDFTMTEIYGLLSKFDEHKDKVKRVTVLSNIMLGVIPYEYYYYQGDLFYGDVVKVIGNKKYKLDEKGEILEKKTTSKFFGRVKTFEDEQNKENPIMLMFKEYNKRSVKLQIYGKITKQKPEETCAEIIKGITVVDLFNENKNINNEKGVL